MKRFVAAVTLSFVLGWSAMAAADATSIGTTCPTNFMCAFSAAETQALVTASPNKPGAPDVFLGYMNFDASGVVTVTGVQNIDGTIKPIGSGTPSILTSTSCTNGANGQPAIISFNDSSQISFVIDSTNSELQFILTKDANTNANSTVANSVRVGVCRKL